jgi:beta-lactamase regulating signal transducer with metallopeptidase domain
MLDSPQQFSFVYGILVPRVAIGRGFVENLTAEELRAALEHERYHVRHLDPLRALLGKALTEAFFLLPSLEVLRLRYEAGRELAADCRAEQAYGRRPLLGALLKALEEPGREPVISASLADPGFLDARISRLEAGREPALVSIDIPGLLMSALGACSFLLLLIAAVVGLGGASALSGMAADELSSGGTLLGALCVAPVVAAAGLIYWRLSRQAGKPLPLESRT